MLMPKTTTEENPNPTAAQSLKSMLLQTVLVLAALLLASMIFFPYLSDGVFGIKDMICGGLKYVSAIGGYYLVIEGIYAVIDTIGCRSFESSKWTIIHIALIAAVLAIIRKYVS